MQAIRVKFIGPSNTRGSRYKATAASGSLTLYSDYRHPPSDNARRAALALRDKFGWSGDLIEGGLPDGSYVFVFLPPKSLED